MFGDEPSIADLSLAGELGNLEAFNFPLKEKFPSIDKWLNVEMKSIPGYLKIHNKGAGKLKKVIPLMVARRAEADLELKGKL